MLTLLACSAALVLLFAALSVNVSITRLRKRKYPDRVTDADLTKAIRAHGNAAEYVPVFLVIFLYFNSIEAGPFLGGMAIAATASRYFHAIGMLIAASVAHRHPLRFIGALGTYLCLFIFGVALLLRAL